MNRIASSRQRGVVLMVVLIVLVALAIGAISLTRVVDMGLLIAGNVAFKQGNTSMGDRGIEAARAWLVGNAGTTLESHGATGTAYRANWEDWDYTSDDPAKNDFPWMSSSAVTLASSAGDPYTVRYVIHRLCVQPGAPTAVRCQKTSVGGVTASTHGSGTYGSAALATSSQVYFQVTVRVDGPRNTVSYVQAVVN